MADFASMNRRGFLAGLAAAVLGATASVYGLALPLPKVTGQEQIVQRMVEALQRMPEPQGRACIYVRRETYLELKGLADRYEQVEL